MTEETRSAQRRWTRRIVAHRPRLLPPEFHEHSRAARKEMLLALRSLIDARIERLERPPEEPAPKKTHRVRVE